MRAAVPADPETETAAFPWEAAMAIGLGRLGLPPGAFWAMTPRELAAALAPHDIGEARPPRRHFEALMQRFPDERR